MTQSKFVTRMLLIFHKSVMMSATPVMWLMDLDLIQKLLKFVSLYSKEEVKLFKFNLFNA